LTHRDAIAYNDKRAAQTAAQERTAMPAPCTVEELSHTAEIGLRIWAPTLAELYACAAAAMCDLVDAQPDMTTPVQERTVAVAAPDRESLLVDWLNELLFLQETAGVYWPEVAVASLAQREDGVALHATVRGWRASQPPRLHVKAVTYHQLRVVAADGGWRAEVFFDI
jgi:SHS2 domain-containing protein